MRTARPSERSSCLRPRFRSRWRRFRRRRVRRRALLFLAAEQPLEEAADRREHEDEALLEHEQQLDQDAGLRGLRDRNTSTTEHERLEAEPAVLVAVGVILVACAGLEAERRERGSRV